MSTVNNYKLWCNDENIYVYTWNDEEPTVCPNVNTHSINTESISIEESVTENKIIIDEESAHKTGGFFKVVSQAFDALPNATTTYDFSYPIKMGVLAIKVPTNANQEGDIMSFCLAPNTIIGTVTEAVSISQTVLNVSQTVIDNIALGFYATITDFSSSDELGQVINIDKAQSTITVEIGTESSFSASGTYIQITVSFMDKWEIGRAWVYTFGDSKIGASVADENVGARITYVNNSSEQKRVRVIFEAMY